MRGRRPRSRGTAAAGAAAATLSLDLLPINEWATVLDVLRPEAAQDRELVLRLTEIGFVPGEAVRIMATGMPGADPLAVRLRHRIGVDTIMWSTDFPHMNTDWPLSRRSIEEQMGDIPEDERRRIVRDNAVELFKLPAAA